MVFLLGRRIARERILAPALALTLVLSGCSGSKSGDATATAAPATPVAGTSPAEAATPSAPPADATGAGSDAAPLNGNAYDPCKKLSLADAQAFFTAPVTMQPQTGLTGPTAGCIFSTADGVSSLQILTVTGPQAAMFYAQSLKVDGAAAVPISGIGDRAVREPKDVWVYAMQDRDEVFCMVHGQHGSTAGKGTGQLKGLRDFDSSSDPPESVASAVAAQLGTLCNKIYGSGNAVPNFSGLQ